MVGGVERDLNHCSKITATNASKARCRNLGETFPGSGSLEDAPKSRGARESSEPNNFKIPCMD